MHPLTRLPRPLSYTPPPFAPAPHPHIHTHSRLAYIINMHPLVGVAALSPHVASTIKARMSMDWVHWMMPTLPAPCAHDCWEGFAVQGK
jgi:hypothetical protein